MEKFIRIVPIVNMFIMIFLLQKISSKNCVEVYVSLLCGLAAFSITAGIYIVQKRYGGKIMPANKYVFVMIAVGIATFVAVYTGIRRAYL
jgi:positive regulator of sigma E activity